MKYPGPTANRPTHAQMVKGLCQIAKTVHKNPELFDMIKMPRKPRKDKGIHRGPCDRAEDRDRPEIVKLLKKDGWILRRIEPAFRGDFSCGDLWGFHLRKSIGAWLECKSSTGKLSDGQKIFQEWCDKCNIEYWVVRLREGILEWSRE